MAASTTSLLRINDTDANFRTWVSAVMAALIAGGLVQTSDTGQINTATVTRPLATNTAQGYAIFRSADASGSLNNFYFKIEFGADSGGVNIPAIWITLGWGSDGAGTITGNSSGRIKFTTSSASATPVNSNFGVGTGYVMLALWTDSGSSLYCIISMERTRTTAGAVQDEVFLYGGQSGGVSANIVVPRTGTVPTQDTNTGAGWRLCGATGATYGGNKGVGVLAPQKGGFLMEAMNIYSVNNTDFPTNQVQFTLSVYGATHTYITGGLSTTLGVAGRMLFRYE